MERQFTVRVPKALYENLERTAARLRRSRSDVVRLALEAYLSAPSGSRPGPTPYDRVEDLLGMAESGRPDLGRAHREHLLSRIRESRERWQES